MNQTVDLDQLQTHCHEFLSHTMDGDPAHDISHVQRVVQNTLRLTETENGDLMVTLPAAWLHDCVALPKNAANRSESSKLSAVAGIEFLQTISYPHKYFSDIAQ